MTAAHELGGATGLVALAAILVLALHVLMFVAMRRFAVPPLAAAVGLGLYALVAFPRFNLRPELLGFVCLAAQLAILSRSGGGPVANTGSTRRAAVRPATA